MSCYADALSLLSRRSLSVAECRSRLADRDHPPDQIDEAMARLVEIGALDDEKLAREYARTAAEVKGRGRLRIARELQQRGVEREVAAAAVGEIFADRDERALVNRAIEKKLRGKPRMTSAAEYSRLYQYLMRQGFTPAVVTDVLRRRRGSGTEADEPDI